MDVQDRSSYLAAALKQNIFLPGPVVEQAHHKSAHGAQILDTFSPNLVGEYDNSGLNELQRLNSGELARQPKAMFSKVLPN